MSKLLFLVAVIAGCGSAKAPQHVGPALGDTHVATGPDDPTRTAPDAGMPAPGAGKAITMPAGPAPVPPAPSNQSNVPPAQPAPQPGAFSPPPTAEGTPGTPVSEPTDVQPSPGPRDRQ